MNISSVGTEQDLEANTVPAAPPEGRFFAGTRFRRIATGILANIVGQLLNVGGQLALVPILLTHWGNQVYGEWLALSAAVATLTTLDLGVQHYVVNILNRAHELDRRDEYLRVLHSGLLIHLVAGTAGFLIALPLLLAAPLDRWLQLRVTPPSTAATVAVLLSMQAAYSVAHGTLSGIYRTVREYARGQMVANARFLANLVLTVVILQWNGGLRAVALMQVLILFATAAFVWFDVARRHPEIPIGLSRAEWRLGLSFLLPSSMFLGIQLVAAMSVQGSTLLVSATFGAAAVVTFVTLRTLSNVIRQLSATLQLAVWPEFTSMEARANWEALQNIHLLTAKAVMLIAICSSVLLVTMGDRLVGHWTRSRVAYDSHMMIAFLVFACSQAHWFTSSILMSACNRQAVVFRYSAASTVLGFVAGYALTGHFGVAGFVYGLAAADVVTCGFWLPRLACRTIGESTARYFREVTLRTGVLFLILYACVEICSPVLARSLGGLNQLLAVGTIIGLIGIAGAYGLVLNHRERGRVNATVSGLLSR